MGNVKAPILFRNDYVNFGITNGTFMIKPQWISGFPECFDSQFANCLRADMASHRQQISSSYVGTAEVADDGNYFSCQPGL